MLCLVLKCFIIWLLTEQRQKKEHPWGMLHFEHINIPTEITNTSHQPYKTHLSACSIYPSHLPRPPRQQRGSQSSSPSTQQLQPLSLAPAHCIRLGLRCGVEACTSWMPTFLVGIGTDGVEDALTPLFMPWKVFFNLILSLPYTFFFFFSQFGGAPICLSLIPPLAMHLGSQNNFWSSESSL